MKLLLTEKQMKRLVDKLVKTELKDTTIKDPPTNINFYPIFQMDISIYVYTYDTCS